LAKTFSPLSISLLYPGVILLVVREILAGSFRVRISVEVDNGSDMSYSGQPPCQGS
jgi:hypothetical protein